MTSHDAPIGQPSGPDQSSSNDALPSVPNQLFDSNTADTERGTQYTGFDSDAWQEDGTVKDDGLEKADAANFEKKDATPNLHAATGCDPDAWDEGDTNDVTKTSNVHVDCNKPENVGVGQNEDDYKRHEFTGGETNPQVEPQNPSSPEATGFDSDAWEEDDYYRPADAVVDYWSVKQSFRNYADTQQNRFKASGNYERNTEDVYQRNGWNEGKKDANDWDWNRSHIYSDYYTKTEATRWNKPLENGDNCYKFNRGFSFTHNECQNSSATETTGFDSDAWEEPSGSRVQHNNRPLSFDNSGRQGFKASGNKIFQCQDRNQQHRPGLSRERKYFCEPTTFERSHPRAQSPRINSRQFKYADPGIQQVWPDPPISGFDSEAWEEVDYDGPSYTINTPAQSDRPCIGGNQLNRENEWNKDTHTWNQPPRLLHPDYSKEDDGKRHKLNTQYSTPRFQNQISAAPEATGFDSDAWEEDDSSHPSAGSSVQHNNSFRSFDNNSRQGFKASGHFGRKIFQSQDGKQRGGPGFSSDREYFSETTKLERSHDRAKTPGINQTHGTGMTRFWKETKEYHYEGGEFKYPDPGIQPVWPDPPISGFDSDAWEEVDYDGPSYTINTPAQSDRPRIGGNQLNRENEWNKDTHTWNQPPRLLHPDYNKQDDVDRDKFNTRYATPRFQNQNSSTPEATGFDSDAWEEDSSRPTDVSVDQPVKQNLFNTVDNWRNRFQTSRQSNTRYLGRSTQPIDVDAWREGDLIGHSSTATTQETEWNKPTTDVSTVQRKYGNQSDRARHAACSRQPKYEPTSLDNTQEASRPYGQLDRHHGRTYGTENRLSYRQASYGRGRDDNIPDNSYNRYGRPQTSSNERPTGGASVDMDLRGQFDRTKSFGRIHRYSRLKYSSDGKPKFIIPTLKPRYQSVTSLFEKKVTKHRDNPMNDLLKASDSAQGQDKLMKAVSEMLDKSDSKPESGREKQRSRHHPVHDVLIIDSDSSSDGISIAIPVPGELSPDECETEAVTNEGVEIDKFVTSMKQLFRKQNAIEEPIVNEPETKADESDTSSILEMPFADENVGMFVEVCSSDVGFHISGAETSIKADDNWQIYATTECETEEK